MSLLLAAKAVCQACGTEVPSRLAASVNADRRPDMRASILDGTFQCVDCTGCGGRLRFPLHLSYVDTSHGQWILAEAAEAASQWRELEARAREIFDQAHGPQAPAVARELGQSLIPRVVFGWAALREKLLARDLELDDVTLELLKIAIIREVPDPPISDRTELRLTSGDGAELAFAWFEAETEAELATLSIPRATYDALADDPVPWQALRADFANAMFVDLRRLFFGS
jgi:hypothetical protein